MGVRKEEEVLFAECKESVGDVFGWKIIIFLPQNNLWRVLHIISIAISFVITAITVFYWKSPKILWMIKVVCDSVRAMDVLCSTLHFVLTKTRISRYGKKKKFIFLVIDYISLIPLNLLYQYLIYETKEKAKNLKYILSANSLLSFYNIPLAFSQIKTTVCSIAKYYFLIFIEIFFYYGLLGLLFSCFMFLNFDEKLKEQCLERFAYCVTENYFLALALLDLSYIEPVSDFPLTEYTFLLSVEFAVGFMFLYVYVTPMLILLHYLYLKHFFEHSKNQSQVKLLIQNVIESKDLKKDITEYFHYAWAYKTANNLPEILSIFPPSFRKTIFCDIHWEAFKHSLFLKDVSPSCKRSLALKMKTEFVLPKTILLRKEQKKDYLMYVHSGLVQIMAEENSESPLLSFSEGTVLGEVSLFLSLESKAVVQTAKLSVIQFLKYSDLLRVLLNYRKDFKKVFIQLQLRLKVAKSVQKCKVDIIRYFVHGTDNKTASAVTNIKWIKEQIRALARLRKAGEMQSLLQNPKVTGNLKVQLQSLQTQIEHTSAYLSLLCVDSGMKSTGQVVCIKDKFPWLLHPQCNFIKVWNIIINITAFFAVVLYPAFLGWFPVLPLWFFSVSVTINFIYIVDILIMMSTAVEQKNTLILDFSSVVYQRLNDFRIYLDILAALPLYLLVYVRDSFQTPFELNLLIMNTLLKSYRLLPTINNLTYRAKTGIFYKTMLKYVLISYWVVYWVAAIFNLVGVECIFYDCERNDWYWDSPFPRGQHYKTISPIFVAVSLVLNIPNKRVRLNSYPKFYIYFTGYVISKFLYWLWLGESVTCYVLEHSDELEYINLIQNVYSFLRKHRASAKLTTRVIETLYFQWSYDKGNYITQQRRIQDELSRELRDAVYRDYLLPVLQKSQLFKWESDQFLMELCRKANRFSMPADSLLLTFGSQTMTLYVIHKGHVQVNSFVVGDYHLGVSIPLTYKSGDTLPVLDAFSQIPAAVTAITVTDCELVTFNLEDILSVMITHDVLPDIIQSLRAVDLTAMHSAKVGLSQVKKHHEFDEASYSAVFDRLKWLGTLLRFILMKKTINPRGSGYLFWETTRCVLIIFNLIFWPIVFGCCVKSMRQLQYIKALLVLDIIPSLLDFYLRLNVGYYNRMGIYVFHPLITSAHYLTSSFIVDFIAFIPNAHMIYLLVMNTTTFTMALIVTHVFLRCLPFYRIIGLLSYARRSLTKSIHLMIISKWLILFLLATHFYLSTLAYLQFTDQMHSMFLPNKQILLTEPQEFYLYELVIMMSMLLNGLNPGDSYTTRTLISIILIETVSLLYQTFLISILTLIIAGKSEVFVTYQHYLRSFVKFLNHEKVDDQISALAIKYFKFKWEQSRGINMQDIFSRFPPTLHEDITFPIVKDSISSTKCLSDANEAFYRTLCRSFQMITLMRRTVIIFRNQVHAEIFFVHGGKCFVEEESKTLVKGAIIGDIRHGKPMEHTVVALTHVQLLLIPSELFFTIMSNFYEVKKAFELETADASDYIESIYFDPDENIDVESELMPKEKQLLQESEFVVPDLNIETLTLQPFRDKETKYFMDPDSPTTTVFEFLFFIDAYVTFMVIPIFVGLTLMSWWALSIIYFLDLFWVVKIVMTSRTALLQVKTGSYSYSKKYINLQYLRKFDGMVLHILSVLPIELIVVAWYGKTVGSEHCRAMYYCYFNRLFRGPYIHFFIHSKFQKLLANVYLKLVNVFIFAFALLHIFVSVDLLMRRGTDFFTAKECHYGLETSQIHDLFASYLYMVNQYVRGGGLFVDKAQTPFEIFFLLFVETCGVLLKTVIVNEMLIIFHVNHYTKLYQLFKLQELDKFLEIRNVPPALVQKMQTYCTNLLSMCKEGAHPSFLEKSPPFAKLKIMAYLYIHNLERCYIFEGVNMTFLQQLAMRLERFVFFPGDYVVEKGDVDDSMYFIQKGKVKCIETDATYPVLERTVSTLVTGEHFGIQQGMFLYCPHSNTYRAKVLTEILVLNYYQWEDLREAFPGIAQYIYEKYKQKGTTKYKHKT